MPNYIIPVLPDELMVLNRYHVRNYADLRSAFLRTRDEQLAAIYAKWTAANAAIGVAH